MAGVKGTKLLAEVVGMAVGGLLACTVEIAGRVLRLTARFESSQ
jgi:hypothetical protein